MHDQTKFSKMIEILRSDEELRKLLLTSPDELLEKLGASPELLQEGEISEGRARGEKILATANVLPADDLTTALKKLGKAAEQITSGKFTVDVEPFGFLLREKPQKFSLDWTATGTTKCTWDPWDGCSPDADW